MGEVLSTALLAIGAAFSLIAAIGVLRFPDLFVRMHCSTKSATLGVTCVMLGVAVNFGDLISFTKALATILFVLVTAPVGTHVLARAAYYAGVPLWKGTLSNEMKGLGGRTAGASSDSAGRNPPEPPSPNLPVIS